MHLRTLNTLRTGGDAERFERVRSEHDLERLVRDQTRVTVLGGGSNVVIADAGVAGLVVHMAITDITRIADVYSVGAGVDWDAFVTQTIDDGYAGLEVLSGIPGTVGATPIQNVGAYGREVGEFILRVRVFDRHTRALVWLDKGDLGLGYRTSIFKRNDRYIVTRVDFRLTPSRGALPIRYGELATALADGDTNTARVRATVLALRRSKGMVLDPSDHDTWSVGSFFTNPFVATPPPNAPTYLQTDGRLKVAAGWLVEQAGCHKGLALGRAHISHKHALALCNSGGATSAEILALADHVHAAVQAKFSIALAMEPVLIGDHARS